MSYSENDSLKTNGQARHHTTRHNELTFAGSQVRKDEENLRELKEDIARVEAFLARKKQ